MSLQVLRTALPLLLVLLFWAASGVFRRARKPALAAFCSSAWFFILFLVYPGCSAATFHAFICDALPDGTPALRVDYAVTCWQGEHIPIVAYALIMVVLYPLGEI